MKLHNSTDNLPVFNNAVITIGTFDGVPCGHQQIIKTLKDAAAAVGGETVIITCLLYTSPSPRD